MAQPEFEMAGGSIIGRDHRVIPRNNQDGFHILQGRAASVGVVTDGCSSGKHSEVGAKIGARLMTHAVMQEVITHGVEDMYWGKVRLDLLTGLHGLALQMGGNFRETINDYFLFTLVGVVIGSRSATFFALGDGVVVVNGEVTTIGPFPGNMPPYVGYSLLEGRQIEVAEEDLRIQLVSEIPVDELDHFLIGCDGIAPRSAEQQPPGLIDLCTEDVALPGLSKTIGALNQFWQDDVIFRNPEALSRRLKLAARDWPVNSAQHGLLSDDATLVVGRRIPAPLESSTTEG